MASLATRITDFATRVGTEFKTVRSEIVALVGAKASLTTTDKSTIVAAINEVKASVGSTAIINDTTASGSSVYSSNKTNSQITAAVAGLVASSPAALDTLNELAAALGNDASFSTTMSTALGNRLRFDAAQTLSAPQKVQGNTNLGSAALVDTGTLDTDFATAFTAALV